MMNSFAAQASMVGAAAPGNTARPTTWHKYGQRILKGQKGSIPFQRSYFRCAIQGCPAKRLVDRAPFQAEDQCDISLQGNHNHALQESEAEHGIRQVATWQWNECTNNPSSAQGGASTPTTSAAVLPNLDYALCHQQLPMSAVMCVCEPSNHSIVWVSPAFEQLTGYASAELQGKNCRILQGVNTAKVAVAQLRHKLITQQPDRRILLNYKKDGTPFWNYISVYPTFDNLGQTSWWWSVSIDVSGTHEAREHFA